MKPALNLCSLALLIVVLVSGCARHRIVSRAMTPRELKWSLSIRASYPAWRPPFLSPIDESGTPGAITGGSTPAFGTGRLPAPVGPVPGPAASADEGGGDVEFVPAEESE